MPPGLQAGDLILSLNGLPVPSNSCRRAFTVSASASSLSV
jgi:hypothetical protein